MKELKLTEKDKKAFQEFKDANPDLFTDQMKDYSKQVEKMRREDPADTDILKGKNMPTPFTSEYTAHKKVTRQMPPEQVKKLNKYWEEVANPPEHKALTYKSARETINQMVRTYAAKEDVNMQFDDRNKNVVDQLLRFFLNDINGPLKVKKSIWLYGQLGTGKTFIARLFSAFTRKFGLPKRFEVVSAEEIAEQVKQDKHLKSLTQYTSKPYCIDDAGQEGIVSIYKEKVDVIERIIRRAYRDKKTLIITSNLAPTEVAEQLKKAGIRIYSIESRYQDERTIDRIYEMFNFVPLLGANKRRL